VNTSRVLPRGVALIEQAAHELPPRLVNTYEREIRRPCQVDLLVVDELALRAMDERETADLYELVTSRHRRASVIVTSNRDPSEWLQVLADPLHAQALVDRVTNNAYDLIVEGDSYGRNQKARAGEPQPDAGTQQARGTGGQPPDLRGFSPPGSRMRWAGPALESATSGLPPGAALGLLLRALSSDQAREG
jgi:hypothetical protein